MPRRICKVHEEADGSLSENDEIDARLIYCTVENGYVPGAKVEKSEGL